MFVVAHSSRYSLQKITTVYGILLLFIYLLLILLFYDTINCILLHLSASVWIVFQILHAVGQHVIRVFRSLWGDE